MSRTTRSPLSIVGHGWAILWTLISVLPFIFIVLLAFKSTTAIYTDPIGLVGVDWKPQNFVDAWNGPPGGGGFGFYLINTVVVAAIAITLSLVLGSFTAYFLSLASARVRRIGVVILLVTTITPVVLLLIPYYQAVNLLGLLSNPPALAIIYVALVLPNTVLILQSFYLGFPPELREAAALDGLGPLRTFFTVVSPLSRGPLVAVAMLNGFNIWGETQVAIVMLVQAQSRTVPIGLFAFQGEFQSNTGAIFAGLTIATVPVLIAYLIFNRQVTKGIALGGVFR
ncbi:carbohydrate ABC transporter permease [Compostimonas suwonensis]|uniref:Raffinose/stachyose/melibiose transport system permease protein n=1 Tax=Compostimonas suwonensis TaxID=1048394 RepID=A0A2M9C517_9MICO|nr:carbohydrate ABC transporter permease [Compostimonas suwonensis]PJJ65623.1 raffinose/stachyose/melibiose transport system permease protein [Compostimonas suwonensis]